MQDFIVESGLFIFFFFVFHRNSRWPPKVAGKRFLRKVASRLQIQIKNFVEITLSRSVSEINTVLHFMQKFKMAAKSGGKTIFDKSRQ